MDYKEKARDIVPEGIGGMAYKTIVKAVEQALTEAHAAGVKEGEAKVLRKFPESTVKKDLSETYCGECQNDHEAKLKMESENRVAAEQISASYLKSWKEAEAKLAKLEAYTRDRFTEKESRIAALTAELADFKTGAYCNHCTRVMNLVANLAALEKKYEALVPERDTALAEAFCARKEHAALTAELSEERSRRVKVMGEMEMELAEEKAKREAAESGFQKVLRFLWECRTIKDLRKELAGFGKSEVEKRADSLARELAAAQEELESIQPDTDEHRTIADSIAGHRKWASATEKCERMCLEKAEKAESELAASRANHIDANTRNMDANDRADSLARELAAKNERLEYLEGQDRSLLEQHQASLITLEDSDLLAVGGRLLDRAEKAEAALSEERSRRVKVMGEGGEDMKNEDGGYAFPGPSVQINDCVFEQHGLTLRDYFAAKVIQGMASVNDGRCPNQEDKKDIDAWRVKCMMQDAQAAYLQADAMIRTREMRPAASPDRGEGEKS